MHINLLPKYIINTFSEKEIFSKNLTLLVDGISINTLDMYDNLIFIVLHCLKHYLYELTLGFLSNKYNNFNHLNLIYEIALYINKYFNIFSMDILFNRINALNVQNEVKLILNILIDIFPSLNNKINEINNCIEIVNKNTFSSKISKALLSLSTTELLFNNLSFNIQGIIESSQENNKLYEIYYKKSQIYNERLNYITGNTFDYVICSLDLSFNDKYLSIDIDYMFNEVLNINYLKLYLLTYDSCYLFNKFTFSSDNQFKKNDDLLLQNIIFKFNYKNNTLSLNLELDLKYLNIIDIVNSTISFNILLYLENNGKEIRVMLNNESYKLWYNVFSFFKLKLKNELNY